MNEYFPELKLPRAFALLTSKIREQYAKEKKKENKLWSCWLSFCWDAPENIMRRKWWENIPLSVGFHPCRQDTLLPRKANTIINLRKPVCKIALLQLLSPIQGTRRCVLDNQTIKPPGTGLDLIFHERICLSNIKHIYSSSLKIRLRLRGTRFGSYTSNEGRWYFRVLQEIVV